MTSSLPFLLPERLHGSYLQIVQTDPHRSFERHSQQLHIRLQPPVPQADELGIVNLTVVPGIFPFHQLSNSLDGVI